MTTKLRVYNDALIMLGERTLASLSENREPRRVLDSIWDNDTIDFCLSQGLWNHASRTVMLSYEPSVTPAFGYTRAIEQPEDFVRLGRISTDETLTHPLNNYLTRSGFWFVNSDDVYVSYISNGASYGANLTIWPEDFAQYVSAYLAFRAAKRITGSDSTEDKMEKRVYKALTKALSSDAAEEPISFNPGGRTVMARAGGTDRRRGR